MLIMLGKIVSMFSIVLVGYGSSRVGWLPAVSGKYLSNLLVNVSAPCVIVVTMSEQVLNAETGGIALQVSVVSLLLYLISTLLGTALVKIFKVPIDKQGVYVFCLTYSNNGFLGLPVALAVFGAAGLFPMAISNMVMGICIYTIGLVTITMGLGAERGLKESLKAMVNIPMLSCVAGLLLFLFQIRLPSLLSDFMNLLGNMMVPLSMLVIGVQLAENGILHTVKQKNLYLIAFLRLIALPVVVFLILMPFGLSPIVVAIMTLTAALPPAALASILTELHEGNVSLAAGCVSLGTFFSLFTVPVVCFLLAAYIG